MVGRREVSMPDIEPLDLHEMSSLIDKISI
jgi:hypothetical protein